MVVSNSSNITNTNCRAISDSIFVKIREDVSIKDIQVKSCSQAGTMINLSKYLYERDHDVLGIYWTKVTTYSPPISNTNEGTIEMDFGQKNHIYQYYMKNECSNGTARFYISGTESPIKPPKQVVYCKDFAEQIHLNRIFGLESGFFEVEDKVKPYITEPPYPS